MITYSAIARCFHWLIAGLIVCQFLLAEFAKIARTDDALLKQLALLANHKSVGMTILLLAVLRLLYRWRNPAPHLPTSMPNWQIRASNLSHFLLYFLLFAMPVTGWLMSSAKAYSVSWFNLFSFPDLVAANQAFAEQMVSLHYYFGKALLALAIVHILAALKHHFIDHDEVLRRMSSTASFGFFIAVALVTTWGLSRISTSDHSDSSSASAPPERQQEFKASKLNVWQIDRTQSFIRFTGDQAGAPFTGEWRQWQASLQFDAEQLELARFEVKVDTSSGFSNDKERDDTIRSSDFFDSNQFGEAIFQASEFRQVDQGYVASGQLTIKGISQALDFHFSVNSSNVSNKLIGSATIDRLLWNIGTGQWSNTDWVGQDVQLEVQVVTQ